MLGKLLGLVVAGVFVGAAFVEIVNLSGVRRKDKKPSSEQTPERETLLEPGYDQTSLQTQG